MIHFFYSLSSDEKFDIIMTFLGSFIGAFFAFLFFVIGDTWKQNKQKRAIAINTLNIVREILFRHMTLFSILDTAQSGIFKGEAMSVNLHVLPIFPIEKNILPSISHLQIIKSIYSYFARIELINDDISGINRFNAEISDLAKYAMLKGNEEIYKETLEKNFVKLCEDVKKNKESASASKIINDDLFDELYWTIKYLKSNFARRAYIRLRIKLSPKYKEKMILKYSKK